MAPIGQQQQVHQNQHQLSVGRKEGSAHDVDEIRREILHSQSTQQIPQRFTERVQELSTLTIRLVSLRVLHLQQQLPALYGTA